MTDFERRLEELRTRAATGELPAAPAGYGDLPLLKAPVWTWEVPAYLFVGGAAGAAAVIGAMANASGGRADLVRGARWIAAVGAAASPPLLISDLGRPDRFLNMLRVFKRRSPMSVGAWTLVAFSTFAAAAALADAARNASGGRLAVKVVGDAAEALSAATGLVLASYTGVLIGATAIPVWSRNVHLLPVHFAASGMTSAVAILELLGHRDRALNALAVGAAAVELAMGVALESRTDPALGPVKTGWSGRVTRAGGVLSGPVPLLLRLLAPRSLSARQLAAASTIAGSLLTRAGWVAAGKESARSTPNDQRSMAQSGDSPNAGARLPHA